MREIVIVITDLYLDPDPAGRPAARAADELAPRDAQASAGSGATPAIDHLARFADRTRVAEGWRAWTADWLALSEYAREAPASVAAAELADAPAGAVWLATPVHWLAGLTSLHFDRRSVLRLLPAELAQLAATFRETFRGSGFDLHPLPDGELVLSGPQVATPAITTDPARMLLVPVAESLPKGEGAAALRRLSAEIEMWLHGHPLNDQRARRGAPPVAALWLWGGGAPALSRPAPAREITDAAFGCDAYVRGLWRLAGGECRPMPVDWRAVIGDRRAQRALAVVEVAELLHAHASWTLADAAVEIDRRLISPSLAALHRGALERLVLLANDRTFTLRAGHRWRLWRRVGPRRGLEALA
ncbi:MAG TPA: hypothetical protein VFX20_21785 [Steroidobacteraceae bacterium]|nr:hypothetical protein [Steroidobacteraceae bacterium]